MSRFCHILFSGLAVIFQISCRAQAGGTVKQPEVILVQLSTGQNMREALVKQGRTAEAAQFNKEISAVYRVIRNDFRDHFHFCPVYYFMDTNLELVRSHRLDGILIGPDGNVVKADVVQGKELLIAYYGYAVARVPHVGHLHDSTDNTTFDTRTGRAWVLCDDKMQQVAYSGKGSHFNKQAEYFKEKEYSYRSRDFDIAYKPIAYKLEETLYQLAPR